MAFPTVSLLDSFLRSEGILSNGEKWKAMHGAGAGGTGSATETTGYHSADSFATPDMAYWVPEEFTNPGVTFTFSEQEANTFRGVALYACISAPEAVGITAYNLRLSNEGPATEWSFEIYKREGASYTLLGKQEHVKVEVGDKAGFSVTGGKLIGWRKKGAGAWEELFSVTDSSYTKGFVGVEGRGSDNYVKNFEAGGGEESESPTVEKPSIQNGKVGHSASLQIKATNTTKYKATQLPKGLSIVEGTGKITGEFETAEIVKTKIKVENAKAETAETEFEWIVTEGGNTNVLGMIVG